MDKGSKQTWKWLPEQMPGVAKLLADKRREVGDEWVKTCWQKGVVERQPGWFFAGEGAIMIGVLWDDPVIAAFAALRLTDTQCMLIVREKGAANGA
jgi:hypothetical protein